MKPVGSNLRGSDEVRTIAAGEFKAKCLGLMSEMEKKNLTVIVTRRGKPVMHITPPVEEQKSFRSIFGRTPGVSSANETEWRKVKDEWADDWEESTERLARQVKGSSKEK